MDFVFDILLPPYLARINLEKAESAYYLYQNWSKSRLPPKKPMWTDRHKIPGHVWTDRHKIPGHVWTDRHKNPGHFYSRLLFEAFQFGTPKIRTKMALIG